MAKRTAKKRHRSSVIGRFVTKRNADRNPRTTQSEEAKRTRKRK